MTEIEANAAFEQLTASIGIRDRGAGGAIGYILAGAATGKVKVSFKNRVIENGTSDAPEETVLRTPQH
jgi:hypothetical protein